MEQELAQVWEELLGVEPIGATDDFFDLGGHSLLAVRLLSVVEERLGMRLPLARFFEGPTVAGMAAALQREGGVSRSSPLVPLVASGSRLPFFCVHPLGGYVFCYRKLANALDADQPFYALQARGLEVDEEPHRSFADMVSFYVEAVREAQPNGPYLLGGWSYGAQVAFDMACALEAAGEEVSALVLIDGESFDRIDEADLLAEVQPHRMLTAIANQLAIPVDAAELERLGTDRAVACVAELAGPALTEAGVRRVLEVATANLAAGLGHVSRRYAGPIAVVRGSAEHRREQALGPDLGWAALSEGPITTHTVPGDHYAMLYEPNVAALARTLRGILLPANERR
ncbi:alpha/beta fold hydrolase [Planctomycetota bacterium]